MYGGSLILGDNNTLYTCVPSRAFYIFRVFRIPALQLISRIIIMVCFKIENMLTRSHICSDYLILEQTQHCTLSETVLLATCYIVGFVFFRY